MSLVCQENESYAAVAADRSGDGRLMEASHLPTGWQAIPGGWVRRKLCCYPGSGEASSSPISASSQTCFARRETTKTKRDMGSGGLYAWHSTTRDSVRRKIVTDRRVTDMASWPAH